MVDNHQPMPSSDEKEAIILTMETEDMEKKIGKALREGFVIELKKPEIDHFERAAIIRQVLDDKGWSIREMARQWGFAKSTIEDWLLFNRIEKEDYDKLLEKGYNHTEIYRDLRDKKALYSKLEAEDKEDTEDQKDTVSNSSKRTYKQKKRLVTEVDLELKQMAKKINSFKKNLAYSEKTRELIDDLRDRLAALKADINIKEKKNAANAAKAKVTA